MNAVLPKRRSMRAVLVAVLVPAALLLAGCAPLSSPSPMGTYDKSGAPAVDAEAHLAQTPSETGPDGQALHPLVVQVDGERGDPQGLDHLMLVELADDELSRQQGLMGRAPLPDDRGMLFVFPDEDFRSFWMKDTPSPLDVVYLDSAGAVVSVVEDAVPESLEAIPSGVPARAVLEVRAGLADELGLEPGDLVRSPVIDALPPAA